MMKINLFTGLLLLTACHHTPSADFPLVENEPAPSKTFSYLALGDSYIIGQGVEPMSSFPLLLEKSLIDKGYAKVTDTKIIAKTGWTCSTLLQNIATSQIKDRSYHLVSLLIGVNDQYQKNNISQYPERFNSLLNEAIRISGDKDRVVVLSIPDYSVTPFAISSGQPEKIAAELREYNKINQQISTALGVKYVNVTDISLKAKDDLSYLAADKLHPSSKMYTEWVSVLLPKAIEALTIE